MKKNKILPQLITILFIILVFGFFTMNAQINMENRGIEFGFGFLKQEASFDIQFSLIDYDGSHSYARAYLVGLLNTLLVAFIGIILSTLLGVVVGVARLSPNYLIKKNSTTNINSTIYSFGIWFLYPERSREHGCNRFGIWFWFFKNSSFF